MKTKSLKELFEQYKPKAEAEKRFVDKHTIEKNEDPDGNGDDVFKADNVSTYDRKKHRQGYNKGEDKAVYESYMSSRPAKDELIKHKERYLKKTNRINFMRDSLKESVHEKFEKNDFVIWKDDSSGKIVIKKGFVQKKHPGSSDDDPHYVVKPVSYTKTSPHILHHSRLIKFHSII